MFRRKKRSTPLLNTTSTADISFMLLIFFLVTTSMDADKGLTRKLPPEEKPQQEWSNINKNNLLQVVITADNQILLNELATPKDSLKAALTDFVQTRGNKHLITLETHEEATYDTYFFLQNELSRAYQSIRQTTAKKQFGKSYSRLTPQQREEIDMQYPQRVAERFTQAK